MFVHNTHTVIFCFRFAVLFSAIFKMLFSILFALFYLICAIIPLVFWFHYIMCLLAGSSSMCLLSVGSTCVAGQEHACHFLWDQQWLPSSQVMLEGSMSLDLTKTARYNPHRKEKRLVSEKLRFYPRKTPDSISPYTDQITSAMFACK